MLLKICWKNIWRNKTRSAVVIASVAIGLWAALFMTAFSWGLYQGHIDDSIETYLSHIQVHHPSYALEEDPSITMQEGNSIVGQLRNDSRVSGVTGRVLVNGMISSPAAASGVRIAGVDTETEFKVSSVANYITEGTTPDTLHPHPIMIGRKIADRLKVKLKSKIVLTFQSLSGEMTAGSFRVCGIFQTQNSIFDETTVFVRRDELAALIGCGDQLHEIAILLKDESQSSEVSASINAAHPKVLSQTWKDLSPELRLVIDSFNEYMLIFIGIILLALMFGIVNTMLMAVLERQREIGMLMAIGMNKPRLFAMVVIETLLLVFIGTPVGMGIAYLSITYFGKYGIDISAFSQGLAAYGFRSRIYTGIDTSYYIPVLVLTAFCAIVSSLYPAYRALRYNPAEAIRKI
jgi:ABC-type lipoprotein release transport system permease subunit